MTKENITYLAIPYTWNPNKSFDIANEVAAKLMENGRTIFSPVSHSHKIADHMDEKLRTSQSFWMKQDLPLLRSCNEVIFVIIGDNGKRLMADSKGCQDEFKEARRLGIDIGYYYYKE